MAQLRQCDSRGHVDNLFRASEAGAQGAVQGGTRRNKAAHKLRHSSRLHHALLFVQLGRLRTPRCTLLDGTISSDGRLATNRGRRRRRRRWRRRRRRPRWKRRRWEARCARLTLAPETAVGGLAKRCALRLDRVARAQRRSQARIGDDGRRFCWRLRQRRRFRWQFRREWRFGWRFGWRWRARRLGTRRRGDDANDGLGFDHERPDHERTEHKVEASHHHEVPYTVSWYECELAGRKAKDDRL